MVALAIFRQKFVLGLVQIICMSKSIHLLVGHEGLDRIRHFYLCILILTLRLLCNFTLFSLLKLTARDNFNNVSNYTHFSLGYFAILYDILSTQFNLS